MGKYRQGEGVEKGVKVWNGELLRFVFKFLTFFTMLRQKMRALNASLHRVSQYHKYLTGNPELDQFYCLVQSLHLNVKQYLRHDCLHYKSKITDDSSIESIAKSAHVVSNIHISNAQQWSEDSGLIQQPVSLFETSPVKVPEKGRIKLAESLGSDKNYQSLMEKIGLIIRYQHKVEKLILPINNQSQMTQICQLVNSFEIGEPQQDNKENEAHPLNFHNIQEDIQRLLENCKNVQEDHDNFQASEASRGQNSRLSQSENQDKKSLLTSMLQENHIMESEFENCTTVKKGIRKPASDRSLKGKQLMKEFDFENYRIEGTHRREKKADNRGCAGQCSQCAIF